MLKLNSLDHVTIIVSDLERTRAFYVGVLGLKEVARPKFDFPGAWFQIGGSQIHATLQSEKAGIAGLGDLNSTSPARGHHFAFEVENFAPLMDHLSSHGLIPVAGPKHRPDGATQVYYVDPDGHVVELFSKQNVEALGTQNG